MKNVYDICIWTEDYDGIWLTKCKQEFVFSDGGPLDNNFKLCPFCGKKIKETKFNKEE